MVFATSDLLSTIQWMGNIKFLLLIFAVIFAIEDLTKSSTNDRVSAANVGLITLDFSSFPCWQARCHFEIFLLLEFL